jgi:hypothetical protein
LDTELITATILDDIDLYREARDVVRKTESAALAQLQKLTDREMPLSELAGLGRVTAASWAALEGRYHEALRQHAARKACVLDAAVAVVASDEVGAPSPTDVAFVLFRRERAVRGSVALYNVVHAVAARVDPVGTQVMAGGIKELARTVFKAAVRTLPRRGTRRPACP